MKNLFYIFPFLLVMACDNKAIEKKDTSSTTPDKDSVKTAQLKDSTETVNTEYLDWDSFMINGKLPLQSSRKEVTALLGEPDSIITPDYSKVCGSFFFENDFQLFYYGKSHFDLFDDTLVVQSLYFNDQSAIELISPSLTLNRHTTLSDLEKLFPETSKQKSEINDLSGKMILIRLAVYKTNLEDKWYLFFKDGKLIQLMYWIPC